MIKRRYAKIPVYIVEDHNDALPLIYRNIGSGYLPFEGNTLVHFDSHPDMLIDQYLLESTVWEKEELYNSLSIENWILPGCYSGQFSKVVWLSQPWVPDQIPSGNHRVIIGKHGENIRVGTPLYYFLSDGIFVDKAELSNIREFDFFVGHVPSTENSVVVPEDVVFRGMPYILDIDLDYFSTKNPFNEMYSHSIVPTLIHPMFALEMNLEVDYDYQQYVGIAQSHNQWMKFVERTFRHLNEKGGNLESLNEYIPDKLRFDINRLIENLAAEDSLRTGEYDWETLYNAGKTMDMFGLPHNVSTDEEIQTALIHFENFLRSLPSTPTIVTIARSSEDDYCPKEQVETIQASVLKVLKEVYKELEVDEKYP